MGCGGNPVNPPTARHVELVPGRFGHVERQVGRPTPEQDRRGRAERRLARDRLGQSQLQGPGQILALFEHAPVQRRGQRDGELVADRVAHGQHGAVELTHQRRGDGRELGLVLPLVFLVLIGGRLRPGVRFLSAKVAVGLQAQPAQGLGHRGGARPAGRQRDPLQPPPRGLQELDQGGHIDRVLGPVGLLQHELRRQAVAREVDQVPPLTLLEDRLEGLARHAILEHAQVDGPSRGAGDRADRLLERVPLLPQVQGPRAGGQAEDGQHPQPLDRGVLVARRGPGRADLDDEAHVLQRQGLAAHVGQLQRQILETLGQFLVGRQLDPDGDRGALLDDRRPDLPQHVLPGPRPDLPEQLGRRLRPATRVGMLPDIAVQVGERLGPPVGRVECDLVVCEQGAPVVLQPPEPVPGVLDLVGDEHEGRHGGLPVMATTA